MFYRVLEEDLARALNKISDYFLSSPEEGADAMAEEWKRYTEILESPLANCPREPAQGRREPQV